MQLAKRAKQLVRNWKKIVDETSGVNGEHSLSTPSHPAVAALQVSPAVSPALGRTIGLATGCAMSPVLPGARPRTPLTMGPRVASPALAGGKPSTPTMAPRVASPAVGVRPLTPSLAGAQRVASPALIPIKSRTTLLSCTTSPVLDANKPQVKACSPALRPTTPSTLFTNTKHEDNGRRVMQDVSKTVSRERIRGAEDLNGSGRLTPSSASENSQDRLLVDKDNGVIDSDSQSSCKFSQSSSHSKVNNQHNHSMGVSLSNSSDKGSHKDQRELSKTNAANRKRTRQGSLSPPLSSSKLSRVEPSSLSLSSHKNEKVINGCVKSTKKYPGAEMHRVGSAGSLPSMSTCVSSPFTPSVFHEESSLLRANSLHRQESADSRMFGQSFDRLSKDKPKVKTTEQLIEGLQKKNNSAQVGTNIITQLRTNQIEKERDIQGSVLPPGMKPKGRRKNRGRDDDFILTIPSSDVPLSQAKTELVQRFLKTSDPSSTVEEYSPFKEDFTLHRSPSALDTSMHLGTCSSSYSKDTYDASFSASRQDRHEAPQQEESSIDEALPGVGALQGYTSSLSLDEIYAQLPPVDSIDWDAVDFYELPESTPVTEETVTRLHTSEWSGVNGVHDLNGVWHGWNQTVSLQSYNGDLLHVLPYVDLDN